MDNRRVDEIDALHVRAVAEGRDTYVDPETGYEVFTAAYLLRLGLCCGSGCRHCPFDYVNVEPAGRVSEEFDDFREENRKRRPS
jgi:hypothetical protein